MAQTAGDIGRIVVINNDAPALVQFDAKLLEPQPLGVRHPADRNQNDIGLDRFSRAALRRLDRGLEPFSRRIDRRHLRRQFERHALLLEQTLRLTPHFAVHARQHTVEEFHHSHLGAEATPHRPKLEPNNAGANHKQMPRDLRQRQSSGGRDNALFVDVDAPQPHNVRAGGYHDRFRFEGLAPYHPRLSLRLCPAQRFVLCQKKRRSCSS